MVPYVCTYLYGRSTCLLALLSLFSLFFFGGWGKCMFAESSKVWITMLSKLGFKIIKSRTSVFKHLNISKVISMLNFLYVFILLIDHNTVSFSWMFLAAGEKLCKEQGIILLAASEMHNREEKNAFLTWSSFSDLQKFMSERKERADQFMFRKWGCSWNIRNVIAFRIPWAS